MIADIHLVFLKRGKKESRKRLKLISIRGEFLYSRPKTTEIAVEIKTETEFGKMLLTMTNQSSILNDQFERMAMNIK